MYWLLKRTILLATTLVMLTGCGTSSSNGLPNPTDPTDPTAPIGPGMGQTAKDGIPDLTGSAPVVLLQKEPPYVQLEELFQIVYGRIVGDPRLKLTLTSRSSGLEGQMLFGFEDAKFWRDYRQNSFPGTGQLTASTLDIIFQDDAFVFRVKADRSGDALSNGTITYRVHGASDNQCRIVTYYCGSAPCASQPPQDFTACRNYMTNGGASVKTLATFPSASVGDWVTFQ